MKRRNENKKITTNSSKNKTLLIFPGYFLPHIGGLETHVDEFSKQLVKYYNYNIIIFTPNIPLTLPYEKSKYITIMRYPAFEIVSGFPLPKFWNFNFWRTFFSLYSKDVDIVMTRTRFFFNSFLGALFAKLRFSRKKLVHVEHGSEFVNVSSPIVSKCSYLYDMTLGKIIFKLSNEVVAISQVSYDFVKQHFMKNKKVHLIRRGIDFEKIDLVESDTSLKGKYHEKIIISFIGRLYKWKGLDNAIKAVKELPQDIKGKIVFIIGGDGEDYQRLVELANNEKCIVFLGSVEFSYGHAIKKASDIQIHSSFPGGALSSSLLEFMYCRTAVVASPHEGANEVVFDKDTGILLKDNSVEEIRRGIITLVKDDKLRTKLSQNAHEYIKKNFAWKRVVEKYHREVLK